MSTLAARCGVHDDGRAAASERVLQRLRDEGVSQVRIAWGDLHGLWRGKTLMPQAVAGALMDGIGMVSTLMLKDTSDRTAYAVFEPGALAELPRFGMASNVLLLPDPASFRLLPWAAGVGWMQAQPYFADGTPVLLDTRRALVDACQRLSSAGYALRCGLEVEFHIYKIDDARLDPAQATWPGEPPAVSLVHPGYKLLAEDCADLAHEPLAIVQHTAQGLGLPLRSLEIELGPSQFEAVFDATDALTAADQMLLFRNGVKQALRRAGYHASFMCRPPFEGAMASGWHLHQSLMHAGLHAEIGTNAFMRDAPAAGAGSGDAQFSLSAVGEHWLAGLLTHARAMTALCTTTVNGYGRFRPHAMAPQSVLWGRDNRGASFRVLGDAGDAATRIENRLGEPMANPYLYIAAQIHAGLDGLAHRLRAGAACTSPYASDAQPLPTSLPEALDALAADAALNQGFASELIAAYTRIKRAEQARFDAASDKVEWQRREYFSRY